MKSAGSREVSLSVISQILNVGAGLLIIPVVLMVLTAEESALWLIFLTVTTLVGQFDFGFSPTITRNVAYVFSGAKTLKKTGISNLNPGSCSVDYNLFKSVLHGCKNIYAVIAVLTFFLLSIAGTFYIIEVLSNSTLELSEGLVPWSIYVVSISFNMFYLYYTAVLRGKGGIAKSYLANIYGRVVLIILSYLSLFLGMGLIGLSVAYFFSVVVTRFFSHYYLFTKSLKEKLSVSLDNIKDMSEVYSALWHNAYRLGLVSFGGFLVNKSTLFMVGLYLPLTETGSYALTLQVFWVLMYVSQTYFQVNIPKISSLQFHGDIKSVREKYFQGLLSSVVLMVLGSVFLIIIGPIILEFIGSETTFLDRGVMLLIAIILLLEVSHSVAATLITTSNNIPFVVSSLISGAVILLGGFVVLDYLSMGVIAIILVQGSVQLIYNNWKWPLEAYKLVKV